KVTYRDTKGDTFHRDAKGYAGLHYTDETGRNDIVVSKVAVGKENVSFYVETAEAITPSTDKDWMLLLVDTDQDTGTGWYGYDILVNKNVSDEGVSDVLGWDGNAWTPAGKAAFAVSGEKMELSIPCGLLGVSGNNASFDFKWADNPGELVDPISICTSGDTAPNRRFNYRFIWKK
ncbi:MAG: hypothetical protein IK076_01780, partial [Bacteroidales bacterium]|nr:hypothetical protein [Bacteroidales bacterium]